MSDAAAPRIVVADDQRAVREALATVLDAEPGLEVVGLAADGDEAVELAHRFSPEVVLMDLRMPNVDGVAATRRLAAELPAVKVVVLTTFADDASILARARSRRPRLSHQGCRARADRVGGPLGRRRAGRARPAGRRPAFSRRRRRRSRAGTAAASHRRRRTALPDDLTPRERPTCSAAIAAGQSNAEIAAELFISEVTVKSHINHLFAKIHARSRAEAVRYAYDHGLVAPPG